MPTRPAVLVGGRPEPLTLSASSPLDMVRAMTTRDAGHERDQTDASLAVERAKADAKLQEAHHVEELEDAVIDKARDTADAVVRTARARTDQVSRSTSTPVLPAVAEERRAADHKLASERTDADRVLRAERATRMRFLERLLPLERDQTDLSLMTERARSDDAVANREDILSMVSHDLRDLLGTIVLSASAIVHTVDTGDAGAAQVTTARRIERAAGRMGRLISDLVDIASIDSGKLAIVPVAVDSYETIRDAIETWSPPTLAKGIQLETRGTGPLGGLFDRDRVLQVLGNLITNAAKFSERGTTIEISAEPAGAFVRFAVRDEGRGIPPTKLESVFERFWQAGKGDRRGLGLGLYISRCIVEAHGGTIWVTSEEAVGSTFWFTVPRSADA